MAAATSLIIRPVAAGDIGAITRIYGHAVTHGTASFELTAPDAAEMGRRQAAITGAGYPYIVALRGDRVLGYAYANAYRPRPAYKATVEDSIYVAPEAAREGAGRALLRELIARCEASGFRQMIAVIGDSGQGPSIALHRSEGFTFAGTLHAVGFKHGRWLDSVLMQRPLGPGQSTPPHPAIGP